MKKIFQFILVAILVMLPMFVFAQSTPSITHNLYFGLRNSEVMLLQQSLQKLGYFSNTIQPTGYFGLVTRKAVQDFQKANGIPSTGYVGPLTRPVLSRLIPSPTICEYPAPPAGCNYVPGPSYNPTTSCGLVLSCVKPLSQCLPADTKLGDVVDAKLVSYSSQTDVYDIQTTTVEQKLNELKAVCSDDNKLIDPNGKQITFYHLTGCWGNPPYNYQDILQKQQDEINKLKEQYTVIEMTCNSSGIPIQ